MSKENCMKQLKLSRRLTDHTKAARSWRNKIRNVLQLCLYRIIIVAINRYASIQWRIADLYIVDCHISVFRITVIGIISEIFVWVSVHMSVCVHFFCMRDPHTRAYNVGISFGSAFVYESYSVNGYLWTACFNLCHWSPLIFK